MENLQVRLGKRLSLSNDKDYDTQFGKIISSELGRNGLTHIEIRLDNLKKAWPDLLQSRIEREYELELEPLFRGLKVNRSEIESFTCSAELSKWGVTILLLSEGLHLIQ